MKLMLCLHLYWYEEVGGLRPGSRSVVRPTRYQSCCASVIESQLSTGTALLCGSLWCLLRPDVKPVIYKNSQSDSQIASSAKLVERQCTL